MIVDKKWTWKLRLFTFLKIPLIYSCKPKVLEIDEAHCRLFIPLRRKTKNHIGSMYFGAITTGADLAGGALVLYIMDGLKKNIHFVFKEVHGEFLRRIEKDAVFICEDGLEIKKSMLETLETKERVNIPVEIWVSETGAIEGDIYAKFKLILSMRYKSK